MPDDIDIDQILQTVQDALKALESINNLDNVLKKLDEEKNRKLFKKIKHTLNECYSKVGNIRERVSKAYKKGKNRVVVDNDADDSISENSSSEKNDAKELDDSQETSCNEAGDNLETCTLNSNPEKESVSTTEQETTPTKVVNNDKNSCLVQDSSIDSDGIIDATPEKNKDPVESNDVISDSDLEVNTKPPDDEKSNGKTSEEDITKEPATPLENEAGTELNETFEEKLSDDMEVVDDIKLPLIKLVDINKLMAPNKAPLDILSPKPKKSVTFDSSVIILSSSDEDTPKKNPKQKDQSPLKSAMRKSHVEIGSDSDSKENTSNGKSSERIKEAVKDDAVVSDDEASDNQESRLARKVRQRKKLRTRKDDISSDDEDNSTKKKSSENTKQSSGKETQDKQTPIGKIQTNENNSDSDTSNKKRKKNKKSSSDDDNTPKPAAKKSRDEACGSPIDKEANHKSTEAMDVDHFKTEVVIKLPRYNCEDLVSMYQNGNRRRGIKLTLKLNKKPVEDSSDEEPSQERPTAETSENQPEIEHTEREMTDEDGASQIPAENPPSPKVNGTEDSEVERPLKISDDSDSDDFGTYSKKKTTNKTQDDSELAARNNKKKSKKLAVLSDSSDGEGDNDQKEDGPSSNSECEIGGSAPEKQPARRRIKRAKDSSSDEEEKSTRKHIRKVIGRDSLSETTKKAEQDEKERKARMAEKQKKYNQIFQLKADAVPDKVVLDFDEKKETPLLSVHNSLVKQLKPHQVQGVKFMWDACFESIKRAKSTTGSGCILAHCMGLGKTLQVITLTHTLLVNSEKTNVEKVMVVCPVNTVLNWRNEYAKWVPKSVDEFEIYELVSCKTSSVNLERSCKVREWHENGGVLIIGYNMFRTLTNPDNKTITKKCRKIFQEGLVDPGPDLVVCDEGHLLKNEKTSLSIAMNRIRTARRIVLTGTPLQNNLREYWCMVQFIKPNLLGTYKEYLNRFVNPITNGQYTDSTPHDIAIMRRRSHVLHKLLDGVVQRQDYAVLAPYLPPKYEYVLFIQLTEPQAKMYKHYIDNFARRGDTSNKTSFLFNDYQNLQRICTHPRVLKEKSNDDKEKQMMESDSEGSLRDFIDDGSEENGSSTPNSSDSSHSDSEHESQKAKKAPKRKRLTRAQAAQKRETGEESDSEVEIDRPREWWQEFIEDADLDNPDRSAKMFLLFEILKECEEIGDKILVFSQSLYTLNCIEYFLERIDESTQQGLTNKNGNRTGSWAIGLDYFRLDGSSSCDNRATWCDAFNNPDNTRARLFLISTKAGGLGINLVAANRVIIFDVSWNPSHDIQSIYRVYRFGQTKPCYIYRFVTHGSMEMKIYERQVTKQAISKRVIDEQQIDRHYSQNDIQELYKTDLEPSDRPIPMVPKDVLLGEMLQKYDKTIYRYHEHQSLLENKQDEELNEAERKAAWEEFENEKELRRNVGVTPGVPFNELANFISNSYSPNLAQMALANIVRKDNPVWSDIQIKGILPALLQQLQMQMAEGNFNLFNRVQQEIALMKKIQAQRQYLENIRMQQLIQGQQLRNQLLGNLNITPQELNLLQRSAAAPAPNNMAGSSRDVIELND